jgi:multiple sugar transport system substrate-binding protein
LSTDAFKEVGLDPVKDAPKTWDDLKRVGEMLKKTENGTVVRKGYDFPYQSQRWQLQAFQPMVEQFGGTLLNEDQTQCMLNSEAAVSALTLWKDVTAVTGDPNTTLTSPTDPNRDFMDGRVAIWMTGPWATNQLLDSELQDHWAVTSLPQLDPENPHTMMYGFTWGVNKDKPDVNKMVAWDFIRFMLSNPEEWLQKASFIQPRVGLLETETAQSFPYIDVHLKDVETATWYLRSVYTNEIVQIVGRAIERTIFQGIDPQASLDQAQEECTNMLAGQ